MGRYYVKEFNRNMVVNKSYINVDDYRRNFEERIMGDVGDNDDIILGRICGSSEWGINEREKFWICEWGERNRSEERKNNVEKYYEKWNGGENEINEINYERLDKKDKIDRINRIWNEERLGLNWRDYRKGKKKNERKLDRN